VPVCLHSPDTSLPVPSTIHNLPFSSLYGLLHGWLTFHVLLYGPACLLTKCLSLPFIQASLGSATLKSYEHDLLPIALAQATTMAPRPKAKRPRPASAAPGGSPQKFLKTGPGSGGKKPAREAASAAPPSHQKQQKVASTTSATAPPIRYQRRQNAVVFL
jgi:hypothetical protein